MPLTVSQTARGWASLRWHEADDALVMPKIEELLYVPGCYVNLEYRSVDVAQSFWSSPWWKHNVEHLLGWSAPASVAADWQPARPLYSHQEAGVAFLCRSGGGLCADQMGLGKTSTAIVAAERLARAESPHSARLIIGPGFTRDVWLRELLALGAISRPEEFCALRGRDPFDPSFRPKEASWWFVHYEVANEWASRLVTNARGRPVVAIVDEAHWVKNGKAKRSKGVAVAAGSAPCRIMLTGTPLLNRPSELWHLLTVLDGPRSWGSPVEFRERYCGASHDGYGWRDGIMPTNQDELAARLSRRYLRRTLADANVTLPPLSRQVLAVEATEAQRKLGAKERQALERVGGLVGLLVDLERGSFGPDVLAALSLLGKLTSRVKLASTVEYLAGLIEQGEAAVCFTHERATAQAIASALEVEDEPRCFVATGEHSQEQRDEAVSRFQSGERRVMVTTYGAMREGVTLHRARSVVLHDLSWRPADVLQAEARVYRIGQSRGVVSSWVMVQDSFDTILARVLMDKAARIGSTIGDTSASEALDEVGIVAFAGDNLEDEARRIMAGWKVD